MKQVCSLFLAILFAVCSASAASSVSRIYGIQVYSQDGTTSQKLVSFPADASQSITVEADLADYNIVAAASDGDKYYMFNSKNGLTCEKYYVFDMLTKNISLVKELDWRHDIAANIIFTDLAYDKKRGCLWAVGYDINDGVGEDNQAPFGLFTIDPATGDAVLVGHQDERAFVALAVNADGEILGVDDGGTVWDISASHGLPNYELCETGFVPVGTQSMAYDYGKNVTYYAGYTQTAGGSGSSKFCSIVRDRNYEYSCTGLGKIGNDAELIGLYVDPNPLPDGVPSVVSGISVTPAANGVAEAVVAWTNPSKTLGGDGLGKIDIRIYYNDKLVNIVEGTEPGASLSWTHTGAANAMATYSISAANETGEGKRQFADAVWVGEDIPGAPQNLAAAKSSDGKSVTVTWEAPVTGAHGGWFNPEGLTYKVKRQPDNLTVADGLSATSYTDTGFTELHGYFYRVSAVSAKGEGFYAESAPVVVGKPHDVPYAADFNKKDHQRQWTPFDLDKDDHTWYVHEGLWGGTSDAFYRYNPDDILDVGGEAQDWLISPPITLHKDKLYAVRYEVRLLGSLFPANTTLAMGKGATPADMTTELEVNDAEINDIEWTAHAISFTVQEDGDYSFGYEIRNRVPVQFYKFEVYEISANDAAVTSMTVPQLLSVGNPSEFTVEVANLGFNPLEGYTVSLVDGDGNTLASKTCDNRIESQKSVIETIEWTPARQGIVSVAAVVNAAADEVPDNDSSKPATLTVLEQGELLDLTAGNSGSGYTPFYAEYTNSAAQTIYPSEYVDPDSKGNAEIVAAVYYIFNYFGTGVYSPEITYGLSNTEKADFSDGEMLPNNEISEVFKGNINIAPGQKSICIPFDNFFTYTGGNLCTYTAHTAKATASLVFDARYIADDPAYSCIYRGSKPFDFTQEASGVYSDIPNVTFLVRYGTTSADGICGDSGAELVYSRPARLITIVGDYTACRLYTPAGTLIGTYTGQTEISTDGLPSGIIVARLETPSGIVTRKLAL